MADTKLNLTDSVEMGEACAITEQGDLGLGITPIDESYLVDDDKEKTDKSELV